MRTTELTVPNPSGIHARPAATFVRTAARFRSSITVENLDRPGTTADAKSILKVMPLGARQGTRIRISAEGPDEDEAIVALEEAVRGGLGEALPE